jgi:hypothetical protein
MSLKTSTLRANFSLGRPNNITPPTSPLRPRIGITKHTSRPYTPGSSKPNGVSGANASGGVGAGAAGAGGVGSSAAGTSTLGSGLGATAGVNAAGAAGKKVPSKHIVWYREVSLRFPIP